MDTQRSLLFRFVTLLVFNLLVSGQAHSDSLKDRIAENHRAYVPSGAGPFPTIVAVPGCSGVAHQSSEIELAQQELNEDDLLFRSHYPRVAQRLSNKGFAVFLIDLLSAEGLIKACKENVPALRIAEYIESSVAWVQSQPRVNVNQIHVIGWSMGGWGTLAWLSGSGSGASSVQSATVVYPGCFGREPLNVTLPTLMLLGEADDIANPSLCDGLVESSMTKDLITVRNYPGARHGFDTENAPAVLDIGNGMTIGYQDTAAKAAWNELLDFFRRTRQKVQ